MRRGALVLTVLAAVSFVAGVIELIALRLAWVLRLFVLGVPRTYWRGAVGLLLFAITLLLLERSASKS
jgi:hypothetical protein